MELICPSCEARYQLPPGSVGEKGRQVSCMNCGHSWHAYPPLELGSSNAPAQSQSTGLKWQGPDGAAPAAPPAPEPAPAYSPPPATPAQPPLSAVEPRLAEGSVDAAPESRSEQLAEIRQMLAEVQSEERAAAVVTTGEAASALRQTSRGPVAAMDPEAERTRLRVAEERAEQQFGSKEPVRDNDDFQNRIDRVADKKGKPTDVRRIRRTHERRIKNKKHAQSAGSGAFLTGFLLIAIIAAVMISLYILHPQIIARVPEAEGPLTEYVAAVDRMRLGIAETFTSVKDWVFTRLGQNT